MEFEKKVVELDVNDVLPNRFQPRIKFNEESINELCESIKEHGVIQPIVVRAMGDKYEIIAGERRYKASLLAGKQTIPAVITNLNDKDSAEVALIENVQRKDLTPIEEAISYKKILDMGYLTQEELAVKLGKTQSTVANKLRLLNLDEEVQEAVLEEKISERHARSLLKLSDMSLQRKMLNQIINNRLTVRKADEEINKLLKGESENMNDEKFADSFNSFTPSPSIPVLEQTNIVNNSLDIDAPIVINDDFSTMPGVSEDQIVVDDNDDFNPFGMQESKTILNQNDGIRSNDMDNIGIPSTPIEDAPIISSDNSIDNSVNPGFVDIENIENNAKDINVEKDEVDINSLLKPSVVGEEDVVTAEKNMIEDTPKEELKIGKFFTLPDVVENKDESDGGNVISPISGNDKTDELAFNTITPINSTPEFNENKVSNNMLDSVLNPIDMINPTDNDITEEKLDIQNSENSELLNPPALNDDEKDVTLEDMGNNLINPNFDFNVNSPIERTDFDSSLPSKIESETLTIHNSNNFGTALSEIRESISKLDDQGFIIDTEEFDFEKEYQIIIKITK